MLVKVHQRTYRGVPAHYYLGYLREWLNEDDPRAAQEQLNQRYAHGGGWDPFEGFSLREDDVMTYPGDPPMLPIIELSFRDSRVVVYPHEWVAIIEKDRSFEICRMD